MSIRDNIFSNVAICKAAVAKNNTITIGKDNREGTDLDLGDEVRVRIIKLETEKLVKARDTDNFTTTIQKTGQIHIPNETMSDLSLETGEVVGYMAVSTRNLPSLDNGPIREKATGGTPVGKRHRESNKETFTGPMASTGQITVPTEVREPLNVKQGDKVTVTINDEVTKTLEIGTGNRITIPKKVREKLGLEKGDEPEITVAVF